MPVFSDLGPAHGHGVPRRIPKGEAAALTLTVGDAASVGERGQGGNVRRSTAGRVGFLSFVLLITTTTCGNVEAGSVVQAASESHAARIPIPGPPRRLSATGANESFSRNWAGYAVTNGPYSSVSASWTVPTVTPPTNRRKAQFSSTWVGIDGYDNGDLIQAGTEQDWIGGAAFYQSWWEILPQPETPIPTITVQPGDVMNVSITQGSPHWTITVTDTTSGQSFTTTPSYSGPLSSAEWIQEAPTVNGRVAALADYGTVDFDLAKANGVNPLLNSSESMAMAKKSGRVVISTPSLPSSDQDGLAVAFGSSQPAPPIS